MVGQPTESLTLLLPEFVIKRLALACPDYIRAWELIHFRERERRDRAERASLLPDPPVPVGCGAWVKASQFPVRNLVG